MSTHKDLLQTLAEARPARLEPGPDRPDPAFFTAHPQPSAPARRRTRRLVLAGLVPVAAAAVAVAVAVAVAPGTGQLEDRPPVAAPPQTAQELFLVAAQHTEQEAATKGRYWVVDTVEGDTPEVGPAGHLYHLRRQHSIARWEGVAPGAKSVAVSRYLGAQPLTDADTAAWKADGSPSRWTQDTIVIEAAAETQTRLRAAPSAHETVLVGATVSYTELAGLPANPAALRAWLVGLMAKTGGTESQDWGLLWGGMALVLDLPVSPQVRAAAYRMLADVKGVTSLGTVTDARGRQGVAVGYTRKGDGGWSQTRLIVDPRTGQALGQETWWLGEGAQAAATGTPQRYTLVVSARFTDDNPPA